MGLSSHYASRGLVGVALTVGLAACAPAATTPPVESPSPTPSAAASAAASSSDPMATPAPQSAAPSAASSPGAPASTAPVGGVGIVRGTVYDHETRMAPDGTLVTVVSLDNSQPFRGTAETAGGSYVLNGVPQNTQLEISVTRPGWTKRTQVGVVRPHDPRIENPNIFNFGGRVTQADRRGIGYFIAPYPEISRVTPTDSDRSQSREQLRFTLTLSEPLDAENRRRLAAAFTIVPNNEEAVAEDEAFPDAIATAPEIAGLRLDDPEDPIYAYRQNSAFNNGAEVSSFTWDDAGLTATFTLNAPMKTDRDDEGEYAFLLVQRSADRIVDADGNPLGMNEDGEFGQTGTGDIIYNAITEPSVNLNEGFDDAEERWADTHLSFTRFSVEQDDTAPTLTAVVARRNYLDDRGAAKDRIELTFSEPMIAYPRIASPGLLSLNNYVLAAAATESELAEKALEDGARADTVRADADGAEVRAAFDDQGSVTVDSDRAQTGNFLVSISVRDPRIVVIDMPAGSLPLDADFIKVLAGTDADSQSVADPAGNKMAASGREQIGPIY